MKGINKIIKKTITLNKQTTSIILAIILTAIILFTTGLAFSSIKDSLIKNIAYQKGNYHLKLNNLPYEDYLKITKENIKTTKYSLKDKIIIKNKHKEEMLKQGHSVLSDDWGSKDDTVYYCTEYIEGELPEIE